MCLEVIHRQMAQIALSRGKRKLGLTLECVTRFRQRQEFNPLQPPKKTSNIVQTGKNIQLAAKEEKYMATWDPELMECVTRCKCGRASDVKKTSNLLQLSETMVSYLVVSYPARSFKTPKSTRDNK